ncbi:uncharacterized protein HMPREF1541_08630 [Cyphellophora europaea CBS 101466]|uniref:non-specific serine/threonine protein kinase n=1 Tax=Cyphellophora europaea (strain CBS 101466) TaxID=1220924 RepID=W2RKW5_CYPE1|nr:uncharacterized protein HMPREF1541_08630 [Cyphellophora europaea CBS 101466]ETN36353.1 hypothetical protein HMPREF1541_08630 [Cyphellophora europaea CBS 101466]
MPPKKQKGVAPKPKKASEKVTDILPAQLQNPPVFLDLDAYGVVGKSWTKDSSVGLLTLLDSYTDGKLIGRNIDTLKLMKFLQSKPGVEEDEGDDQWKLVRYLGAGTFGRVGLWVKISEDGELLDSIAIKEADHMWMNREANKREPNLPIEVAIQRDLNTYDATSISYLRNYKYGAATRRGRLYLKHYKYGNLDLLHKAYAIYGHWLPEWFCYEILLDFCASLRALDQPPPEDTKVDLTDARGITHEREDLKTIHQDIKPENVFLDDLPGKDKPKKGHARPVPVLADFGEADYTYENHANNPRSLACGGTQGYKPREELAVKKVLDKVERRENLDADDYDRLRERIIPRANNVWGIGRVVFELMTHIQGTDFGRFLKLNDDEEDYDHDYMEYQARDPMYKNLEKWKEMLGKVVDRRLGESFPYSEDRIILIGDMLNPIPRKRPGVDEIQLRAETGLKRALDEAGADDDGADTRGKKSAKSTKSRAKSKSRKARPAKQRFPSLYYTQEQWATIPTGPIDWTEEKPEELDWLRDWAYRLLNGLDPDGPMIRQPDFMKNDEREWLRVSDLARKAVVKDRLLGNAMSLKDLDVHNYASVRDAEKALQKEGRSKGGKGEEAAEDDVAHKEQVKKVPRARNPTTKPAAGKAGATKKKAPKAGRNRKRKVAEPEETEVEELEANEAAKTVKTVKKAKKAKAPKSKVAKSEVNDRQAHADEHDVQLGRGRRVKKPNVRYA